MQELIDTLNIAKGTLYHYYKSKQQLLEAVAEDIVDEEFRKKEKLLNGESGSKLKALDKLKILITESGIADTKERYYGRISQNSAVGGLGRVLFEKIISHENILLP